VRAAGVGRRAHALSPHDAAARAALNGSNKG
jgi:hypothetical protein